MKSGRLPRKLKKMLMNGSYFKKASHITNYNLFSIQVKEYLQSLIGEKRFSIQMKKIDYSKKENQIGCGYCAKEKSCPDIDPKKNKANSGCKSFIHFSDKFNDRSDFIEHGKPEFAERTKKRLQQIASLGMDEIAPGQFGIENVISGLYIEMVWSYSNEQFDDYMEWADGIIFFEK